MIRLQMAGKSEFDPYSTPPKLTLKPIPSFTRRSEERPGMATPPIRLAGAIPFRWEEAPGRPRLPKPSQQTITDANTVDRRISLPPRLSASASTKERGRKGMKMASPSTVLDGPYLLIRRHTSCSLGKERKGKKVRWDIDSSEKSSTEEMSKSSSSSSSSSSKSLSSGSVCSYSNDGGESNGEEAEECKEVDKSDAEKRKVRVLRYRRKRTIACHASYTASRLWATTFGRLKQAIVPRKKNPKTLTVGD